MSILGGRRLGGDTPPTAEGRGYQGPSFIGRDVRGYPPGVCGIGGMTGAADEALLRRMAEVMVKRGPDGSGVWTGDSIGLVATRLAIIDLHERSNQPMSFGGLTMAFNGEIYNYRELRAELQGLGHAFRTEGDAEVLLHSWSQWGDGALDRLNGMFAFAIWNEQDRSLSLATDPFGEKPLYVVQSGSDLIFASELKALAVDPRVRLRSRDDALAAYVSRGAMPIPPDSFFVGVERL